MDTEKRSRFDLSQMGEADRRNLASTCLEAVKRFYEDPENIKRFEAWKKQRAQKEV